MKKLLLLPLLALLCMQACKKDDADNEPQASSADYFFPLKVGNYWVYETLNTQNNSTTINTISILGDTVVNGRTFYRFNSISPISIMGVLGEYLLADSSGYIIDPTGFVYMANNGAMDTIEITSGSAYDMVTRTGNRDSVVNVPAGSFYTLETVADVYYKSITSPTGINPRSMHSYAAKNIGNVKSTYFYYASVDAYVITLKSYHLEL